MNTNISVLSIKYKDDFQFFSERALEKASAVVDELGKYIYNKNEEYLMLVALNAQCIPISVNVVAVKDIQGYDAFPRDVLRTIALSGAYAVTIIRNRTGACGVSLKPTTEDDELTDYFVQLTRLSSISLIDYIIVGSDNNGRVSYFSYREKKKRKISPFGKMFQDMMGDFRVNKSFFPNISLVTNGWSKDTIFSSIHTKDELSVFFNVE